MPTPITTEAMVDQLFDLWEAQGVAFGDLEAAKAAAVPIFQNWLGGDNALPAESMRTALNVLGRQNSFVLNQYEVWTTAADGGPNEDGTVNVLLPDGSTEAVPGWKKIIDATQKGNAGWSPVLVTAADGPTRVVLQVTDWTGGEGTKPAVGDYLGPDGLVALPGDAVDMFAAISGVLSGLKDDAQAARDEVSAILAAGVLGLASGDMTGSGYVTAQTRNLFSYSAASGFNAATMAIPAQSGGAKVTLIVAQRARTGATPRISLGKSGIGIHAATLQFVGAADGVLRAYEMTVPPGETADLVFFDTNGAAEGDVFILALAGATYSVTSAASQMAQLLLRMVWDLQRVDSRPDIDSALRGVGAAASHINAGYDTLTVRGLNSFSAVAASGYKYVRQALAAPVADGGKLTLFYIADPGSVAASPRAALFRPGVGVVSNTAGLTLDGLLRSVVLTASGNSAPEVSFDSNGAANYGLRYVAIPGAVTETTPLVASLVSTLLMLADIAATPAQDTTVRRSGLVTGPSSNTSMDTLAVNGLGDLSFVETSGAASYARTTITPVPSGTKATLVYRILPRDGQTPVSGSLQAQLERLGLGAASSTLTLRTDGRPGFISFTTTQEANRILWIASRADLRAVFALLPGDLSETTVSSTGLAASLLAALNVLVAPLGGEVWTDDDKLILWPTPVAFVEDRPVTIYGRQVVKGRKRQFELDVSLVCPPASEATDHPGLSVYLTPQMTLTPGDLSGSTAYVEVKDPAVPNTIRRKAFTRRIASASQTGAVLVTVLGDSTAALGLGRLKGRVEASGAVFTGVGTLTSGGVGYEGRAGWSALNYIGRTRPSSPANPFLRSVPAATVDADPDLWPVAFADDDAAFNEGAGYAPGTGVRTSYAEDEAAGTVKATYSYFDWSHWRQNAAVSLTGSEKLRVVLQLGRNGTTSATWLDDNELAQGWIVENFLTSFPNGTMLVASEAVGEATDTANALSAPAAYRDRTAALIQRKMKLFDDREADRVWLVPAWALMNAFAGFKLNAASATDADTGTTTHTVNDVVHYEGQVAAQWAEALLGPLLYVHETT